MAQRESASIGDWVRPEARRLQRHTLFIAAPPARTFEAVEDTVLRDVPVVRALFRLRGIPHRREMTLRQFFSTPPFLLLTEDRPRELVFGVAGPFSPRARRDDLDLPITPVEFRTFAHDGCLRAVANFKVDAARNGSLLSTETWVEVYGTHAARWFAVYWRIIGPFSAVIRRQFLRAAKRRAER